MNETKEITYKTRDLYEASFHYAANSESFVGLEQDGRDFLFVFNHPQCKRNSSAYYARQATVVAKDLTDGIRTMKDYLFNELRAKRQAEHW